jgi:hypothetical protein
MSAVAQLHQVPDAPRATLLRAVGVWLLAVLAAVVAAPESASAAGQPFGPFGQSGAERVDVVSLLSPGTGPNPTDQGYAIAKGRADETYVTGEAQTGDGRVVTLKKFNAQGGVPDFRSPNAGGYRFGGVVKRFTGENGIGLDVAYDTRGTAGRADDRIYVAGSVRPQGGGASEYLILRYLRNGQPDGTFGEGGVVRRFVPGTTEAQANAIAISGNRIFVAGSAAAIDPNKPVAGYVFVAAHRITNGNRIGTFGNNGVWKRRPRLDIPGDPGNRPSAEAVNVGDMEIDADRRRIFLTGGAVFSFVTGDQPINANEAPFTLAVRSTTNSASSLAPDWNHSRPRYNDDQTILSERGTGVAVGEDGELFTSITRNMMFGNDPSLLDDILVVRFRDDGTLNNAFGAQGVRTISDKDNSLGADGIAFERNSGKVTVAGIDWGAAGTNGDRRVLLVRLRSNGDFDPEFSWPSSSAAPGDPGFVRRNVLVGEDDRATGIVIDGNRFAVSGRAGARLLAAKFRR